ncbi:MAG TPA: flagellar biosynthetic protein FliP, partial [Thermodesulfobacterium commune]|nr:flagellar biosynthetic protein FliP [Thermodesulfobacterium commune]
MMVSFLAIALPTVKIGVETAKTPEQFSTIVQVLILLTVLSIAPALLLML